MTEITTASRALRRNVLPTLMRRSGLIWVFILLCIVAALISPSFLNPANLLNVARQVALFGIISVGMTFVILTKGIDRSIRCSHRWPTLYLRSRGCCVARGLTPARRYSGRLKRLRSFSTSARHTQPSRWSLTKPIACMNA